MNCQFCSMHRAFRIGRLETVIDTTPWILRSDRTVGAGEVNCLLTPFSH
jgi:hypothetical protein